MNGQQARLERLDGEAAQRWIVAHPGYYWGLWAFEHGAQVLGVRLTSTDPSLVHDALLVFRRPILIRKDGRITPADVAFTTREASVPGHSPAVTFVCTATQDRLVWQIEAEQISLYHWIRAEVNYEPLG